MLALEQSVAGVKSYMDAEQVALEKAKGTLQMVESQKKRLQHMKENLPDRLPQARKAAAASKAGAAAAAPGGAVLTAAKEEGGGGGGGGGGGSGGIKKKTKSTKSKRKAIVVPRMEAVLVDEFNAIPKYIRGRFSRDQVNLTADAIYDTLCAKYKILGTTRAKLGDQLMSK